MCQKKNKNKVLNNRPYMMPSRDYMWDYDDDMPRVECNDDDTFEPISDNVWEELSGV